MKTKEEKRKKRGEDERERENGELFGRKKMRKNKLSENGRK
jgi:hypothetical protein